MTHLSKTEQIISAEISDEELMTYFDSAEYYPEPPRVHRLVKNVDDIIKIPGEKVDRNLWDERMMQK